MAKEPKAIQYLDDEERELAEAIESSAYEQGESLLTAGNVNEYREMARMTMNDSRSKITIRIADSDLARLKARALREGLPYQTLIGSILHKAVTE